MIVVDRYSELENILEEIICIITNLFNKITLFYFFILGFKICFYYITSNTNLQVVSNSGARYRLKILTLIFCIISYDDVSITAKYTIIYKDTK